MRSIVHSAQRQTVVESFVDRPAGRSERMASQQEILARGAGDIGNSRPATGESGEGNGSPLQGSCPEDPMDRGAWQATVHGVTRVGHDLVTKPTKPTGDSRRQGKAENGEKRENNGQNEKKRKRRDKIEKNLVSQQGSRLHCHRWPGGNTASSPPTLPPDPRPMLQPHRQHSALGSGSELPPGASLFSTSLYSILIYPLPTTKIVISALLTVWAWSLISLAELPLRV